MDKFQNKYRIPTNRMIGFDYGSNAFYFVTICTKNREHYFGEIINNNTVEPHHLAPIKSNELNGTKNGAYNETHNYASVNNSNKINEMQNGAYNETHNDASLQMTEIGKIAHQYWAEIPKHYPFVTVDEFVIMPNHIHGILYLNPIDKNERTPNIFGPQSNNLGAIIRGFKSSVKRYANEHHIEFEWQPRYHDRIIRDEKEYSAIKNYIFNNPANWKEDKFHQ